MRRVRRRMVVQTFTIPAGRGDLLGIVYSAGEVVRDREMNGRRRLQVRGHPESLERARKQIADASTRR
uniref:Uncharacterized protein n=1 Tax=candidate division WOR-3 bacterium TaxID=2052148 RepID=A0A7C4GFL9_UNCW3